jgi:hypothetical protein
LDLYLEIRGGTCGKVDSFDGAGAFIERDVGLIGENNVHTIGAISAVKPNELWAQRVCFENFPGHFTFFLVFRSGTPEPSKFGGLRECINFFRYGMHEFETNQLYSLPHLSRLCGSLIWTFTGVLLHCSI